jgi:platelet-activating factor acetylhydrolase
VLSLTPLTSPLPPYTGQHEVGVLDVETEVERRVVAEGVLKDSGDAAFEVC